MDNNITALKNLYVALGGTAADVADITIIPDMINAIATQFTTGTSMKMLPSVNAADNGKVLIVRDGYWTVDTIE